MKSILFSLFQHFWTLPFRDAVSDTNRALRGLLRALFFWSADTKVMSALRTSVCTGCPFYDAKWKTCGTPGETIGDPPLKVGCWCYLPIANADPKKDCYARVHRLEGPDGSEVGWPNVLRPLP